MRGQAGSQPSTAHANHSTNSRKLFSSRNPLARFDKVPAAGPLVKPPVLRAVQACKRLGRRNGSAGDGAGASAAADTVLLPALFGCKKAGPLALDQYFAAIGRSSAGNRVLPRP